MSSFVWLIVSLLAGWLVCYWLAASLACLLGGLPAKRQQKQSTAIRVSLLHWGTGRVFGQCSRNVIFEPESVTHGRGPN